MAFDESGSRNQKIKLGVAIGVFVIAGIWVWVRMGGASPADIAAERVYICSETGQIFEYVIKMGDREPVESPHTGRRTGYKAEACYWMKDDNGRWAIQDKPTWVLVAKQVDSATEERTYCPDCGREVVRHNPLPTDEDIAAANAEGDN